ncbi:hypothetical protein [Dactylosporangium sp. CA-233914]|uniref:Tc toxin subunit A-related protein n=1 Tax=Dactylosporangium sp. CA-233914 TaxID=3239934 RepID=UPI003D924BE6
MTDPHVVINIITPAPGAQVTRTLSLSGGVGLDPDTLSKTQVMAKGSAQVGITFNGLNPVGGTLTISQTGIWQLVGATVPASIADGATVVIKATGTADWTDIRDQGHETFPAVPATAQVTVQVEARPPELAIVRDYPSEVTPPVLPFVATVHGTTSGALSGINEVRYAVTSSGSPGPSGLATNLSGDWSSWQAQFSLPAGDHQFTITAGDTRGRHASQSGAILVHEPFEQTDPSIVFGPTIYVRELSDFAAQHVSVGNRPPGPDGTRGLDRALLAARFRQPYDRMPDAAAFAAATAPVDQRRVAVEVLRRFLTTPLPAATDQQLRGSAYESLLREMGTSTVELRQARIAEHSQRAALAARLGIDFDGSQAGRLDQLTISPEEITDAQLEELFGFRSMQHTDPFVDITTLPLVQGWRQATLRQRWRAEDVAQRDSQAVPVPVIEPDHVRAGNIATARAGDPCYDLWAARQAFVAALAGQIDQAVAQGNRTPATFDQLVATHIGPVDLADLAARDAHGEDVTGALAPLQLDLAELRYLAGARALLATGGLLTAEWGDVRDILVQVRKRRVFAQWRQEERAADIVLQPQQFLLDPPAAPGAADEPVSIWRGDPRVHLDWQRTLSVRGAELDRLGHEQEAMLQSADAAVLPLARDALLAFVGSQQSPPEPAAATAERLSRELCIDLVADSAILTTRADSAAQTLLEALLSLRSGRLSVVTGGQEWSIAEEERFDAKFAWYGAYQTWYAAITSFAYPQNHLFPGLYVPDGLTLRPTGSYGTFLHDLRAARITAQRARLLAQQNRDRMLDVVRGLPGLSDVQRKAITDLAPVSEVHTNQELDDLRTTLLPLYGITPDADQAIRELYWLVPVALGLALTEAGEFVRALDWYQVAYAYQLPPARRRVFPGMSREQAIQSAYGRSPNWPVDGSNPHQVATDRADAYTHFTVMSIVRCLLAYADNEFVRNTAAANARARGLYEAALELIRSADAASVTGQGVPFPANPVRDALQAQAQTGLDKIHRGLNLAGTQPDTADDESTLPSQYRYAVIAERARNLVAIAQQLEAAFLSAAEQADAGAYSLLQAGHDLTVARGMISENDLKVSAADLGVQQAGTQFERASVQAEHYRRLLAAGQNEHERQQLFDLESARDLAAAGGALSGLGAILGSPSNILGGLGSIATGLSQAASLDAQIEQVQAGFERQREEWQLQQSLAVKDVEIGREQVALAGVQAAIAVQERAIAGLQLAHATATADFLATKFTSAELFDWMSGVLNQVYGYFLRQATALGRLAQAQLAFERQEPNRGLVQDDYWQGPPDPATGSGDPTDRRGLTGAARLLADLTRLDQYAFETDKRKLHLTQTLSMAQLFGREMQLFRQSGVLTVATPQELFDREFPGHYLRLIKQVKVSLLALVPPVRGVRATLSASGVSRAVVARGLFQTVTLRRDPESIAFTSPVNATGLFDLEPDTGLLLPFEGMGVDTVWRLDLPRAANPFDYRTIADVLLTLEYTALSSEQYRQRVIPALDRTFTGDRTFSLRDQFPDVWYELGNPDTVEDPATRMRAVLPLTEADFPPNIDGLTVAQLTLFVVRADGTENELTVAATRHTTPDGHTTGTGPVGTVGGIIGTRRPAGSPWLPLLGAPPAGVWELQLEDTPLVRNLLATDKVRDLVLVMTVAGTAPAWT